MHRAVQQATGRRCSRMYQQRAKTRCVTDSRPWSIRMPQRSLPCRWGSGIGSFYVIIFGVARESVRRLSGATKRCVEGPRSRCTGVCDHWAFQAAAAAADTPAGGASRTQPGRRRRINNNWELERLPPLWLRAQPLFCLHPRSVWKWRHGTLVRRKAKLLGTYLAQKLTARRKKSVSSTLRSAASTRRHYCYCYYSGRATQLTR